MERHDLLENTIGVLSEEQNSYENVTQGAADRLKHTRDENRRGSILHTITKRR